MSRTLDVVRLTGKEYDDLLDARDRLVDIVERRRKLLERVLQCGLCEEPHGVGFTPSRQERIASDLARDIGNELRGIDALVKG